MTQTFWQTSLLHLMSFDVLFYEHVLTQFDLHVVRNIQFVTLFTWLGWLSVGHQATPWGLPAQENRRKVLRCKSTNYNHSLELLSSLRLISGARLALIERIYAIIRYVATFFQPFLSIQNQKFNHLHRYWRGKKFDWSYFLKYGYPRSSLFLELG